MTTATAEIETYYDTMSLPGSLQIAVHGLGKPCQYDIAGRADGGSAPLHALRSQNAGGGKARRATGGKACEAEAQGLAAREGRQLQSIAVAGHLVVLFFPGQWSAIRRFCYCRRHALLAAIRRFPPSLERPPREAAGCRHRRASFHHARSPPPVRSGARRAGKEWCQ